MEATTHKDDFKLQSLKFDINTIPEAGIIETELYNVLSDSTGKIHEMCNHILNAGGKRIRPLLVLYSGSLFSGITEELMHSAIASELIHMASLVHDDIIDGSHLRRNKPSINKVWGTHFAVLCGDYLFAKAFGILSSNRLIKSMDLMVESIQNMCYGEILQADDMFNNEVNMEKYYERITKKTAMLLQYCCKSGALTAGANEVQAQIIGEYGLNLGLAYQIIDDILDFCGESETMGKPKGEDLRQGIITIPIILLMRDKRYKSVITKIVNSKDISNETINDITILLNKSGTIDESFSVAVSHIEKAKQCLALMPESPNIKFLYDFTNMLQARMN